VSVEVTVWPDVSADFRTLPTERVRWEALRYMALLRSKPHFGIPLQDHPTLHDLSDCRKIYLDESYNVAPRWPIVYRLLPDDANPTQAEVIVIWPKEGEAAYHEAARRLGRLKPG
jgi:hypothetical protein